MQSNMDLHPPGGQIKNRPKTSSQLYDSRSDGFQASSISKGNGVGTRSFLEVAVKEASSNYHKMGIW